MTERSEVERVVRGAYAARVQGDLDAVMGFFADDAHYAMLGSSDASPVPMAVTGAAAVRETLGRLIGTFEFLRADVVHLVVEGANAAAHTRVRLRMPDGREAETEVVDLLRIENGRIASMKQFADTALATQLLRA